MEFPKEYTLEREPQAIEVILSLLEHLDSFDFRHSSKLSVLTRQILPLYSKLMFIDENLIPQGLHKMVNIALTNSLIVEKMTAQLYKNVQKLEADVILELKASAVKARREQQETPEELKGTKKSQYERKKPFRPDDWFITMCKDVLRSYGELHDNEEQTVLRCLQDGSND
jgi:hypothetical protein